MNGKNTTRLVGGRVVRTITRFGIWALADNMVRCITHHHNMIQEIEESGHAVTIEIIGTDVVIDAPLPLIFAVRDLGYDIQDADGRQV